MADKYLILTDVNSSGQGQNIHHNENPFHQALTAKGWKYSHTTPCQISGGERFAHHTYILDQPDIPNKRYDWYISVDCREDNKYILRSSRGASNTETVFILKNGVILGDRNFPKYLNRKTRELHREAGK